jgi:hypothetical protein
MGWMRSPRGFKEEKEGGVCGALGIMERVDAAAMLLTNLRRVRGGMEARKEFNTDGAERGTHRAQRRRDEETKRRRDEEMEREEKAAHRETQGAAPGERKT